MTRPNTKICAITLLSAIGIIIYIKKCQQFFGPKRAQKSLTLAYKLNSVCNAGFWPTVQIKKTCIPKWDTHKNQLQAQYSTGSCVCQDIKHYI